MSEPAAAEVVYDVVCPHCKKSFQGQLLSGSAARYQGFKCPHCKLFVPFERVSDQPELVERPD
jgi:DNA-directed RNA polymerase subunit RPC12/RpoP